ncbi:MAG: MCP four helix bundle domain-containing protein [Hydrogenophaga sp.]|nr:MCP four helix bundle domain-containing protein [Hydrogenophaga sp.]
MKLLGQMKLGRRLALGFGLVLTLLVALAAAAWVALQDVKADLDEITDNAVPSLQVAATLKTHALNLRRYEYNHLVSKGEASMKEMEGLIARTQADMVRSFADYEKLVSNDADRAIWQAARRDADHYMSLWKPIEALSRQNTEESINKAEALMTGESRQAFTSLTEDLDKLWAFNVDQAVAFKKTAEVSFHDGIRQLLGVAVLALLVGVVAALLITRSIVGPIRRSLAVAEAVAAGDLTQRVTAEGKDETAQLLKAMDHMTTRLSELVTSVRLNAEGVATASAQIAQGNQDLSSRTEQQASALEETSASMEEMGSTAQQNADNARTASQLATSASGVAQQGGEVVGQVVSTMREIQHSSQKIADIIGVIDGIAFQTNILALNAAVEAARAGEQGRGFAVVAGEVRTLAQRSAEAAKEIKQLINASVERVEQGTALVDQAGNTMQEVVQSIQRVTDIVGEISSASQEQNAGVVQVAEAVSNMDQATQQNAALVEESASAAASLRQQADQLVASVAAFRTAGGAQATVHAPASARAPAPTLPTPSAATRRPAPALAAPVRPASNPVPAAPVAPVGQTATRRAPVAETNDDWESF